MLQGDNWFSKFELLLLKFKLNSNALSLRHTHTAISNIEQIAEVQENRTESRET